MKKPKDMEEYKDWFKEQHNIAISAKTQTYYESVTNNIKRDFEKSDFWSQLTKNLDEYNSEYHVKNKYQLLMPNFTLELEIKPFNSFLEKTFRKNIIENKYWPEPPSSGWIFPSNWFSRINDTVRTLITVKYLDGVDFIAEKIKLLCEQNNLGYKIFLEAREEGYYAAHQYISKEFEIPKIDWDTEKIDFSIEIQITTQLQEIIRSLLHKYYDEKRKTMKKEEMKWQWNYRSDEFTANYLGHILHYVEGMIMEIRDK